MGQNISQQWSLKKRKTLYILPEDSSSPEKCKPSRWPVGIPSCFERLGLGDAKVRILHYAIAGG